MALTIVQSDQATAGQKAGAIAYLGAEGLAHTALVVGSVACISNVAGCVTGAKTALGIGGTAAEAACADGDCTNEVGSLQVTGKSVIDFLPNQVNTVTHILQSKHGWDNIVNLTGNISKDYDAIQPYIQQAINNGTTRQIGMSPQGVPIFQYVTRINGVEIVVNAMTMTNGVIQVVDSWVKTR